MSQLKASYRDIWSIAYPLILGNVAQTLITISDTAFMGRVGETSLAAIGYVSLFYLILFMFGFSYTKGTQILIARKQGEGYKKAVGLVVDNTIIVLGIMSVVLAGFVYFFSDEILQLIISNDLVREESLRFLKVRAFGFIFSFIGSIFLAYYMGIGETKILAATIGFMALLNVILNYLLIFGNLGMPQMGIAGAALASNISEAAAMIILIVHTIRSGRNIEHYLFKFKYVSLLIIKRITTLSLPLVLQSLFGLGAWFVFFTLIEKLGETELAISNIVKMIFTFVGIPTFGFASAVNTIVSNIAGQGRWAEVGGVLRRISVMSFGFSLLIVAILAFMPRTVISVFTDNPALIEDTVAPLYVIMVALLFYSVSTVLFNGIVSIGSTKVSLVIEVIIIVSYLIFIYFIFYRTETTLVLAWTSEWVYWILLAIASYAFLKFGNWKEETKV